ncbi:hypothetical protein BH708_18875 [Brachybacterium sp. P6-10-X1]|nr:hypothetical protein BH708_18875 [Brachybacterium sp. P6-10-X1]
MRGAGTLAVLGAAGAGAYTLSRRLSPPVDPRTVVPLFSTTVAYDASGSRQLVGADGAPDRRGSPKPGTRVLETVPEQAPVRERAAAFLAGAAAWTDRLASGSGSPAAPPALRELGSSALADLWVLTDELPAPVAGWSRNWRFIWPRDAAFAAVALARIGLLDRALDVLTHLQSLQAADGWYEARYVPGTGRAPDDRARQFDGTGLVLWAAAEVARTAPEDSRAELVDRLTVLISTSQRVLLASTGDGTVMPPVSPDYWEVHERSVTLGIMAATLAGLRAGAELTGQDRARRAAVAFESLLTETFGAHGYQRHRRGGGADSALAFLDATGCHDIAPTDRLLSLRQELARPAGGIAPGASWKADGISWTPSTSLLALAFARSGRTAEAEEILTWLAEHRTGAGSLPEKVLFDGRPAAVAPLAWTAANVLLALDALSGK